MKTCSLPDGSVIFSIKLPNMMQMQETLTGSTFDHVFSFFLLSLTLSLGRFHVKSITQKTDHVQFCSKFRCQFTSGRETTVPNFRIIGHVFLELRPSKIDIFPIKSGLTATSRHSLINNFSNN